MSDKFYIIAAQDRTKGEKWDFVAGPYASEAQASANQEYAVREYASRKQHPEWFRDADISVVQSDMRIPTALGPIGAKEQKPVPSPPASGRPPDFRADVFDALMTRMEAFGDEFSRLATTNEQKALARGFGDFTREVHDDIAYIAGHHPPGSDVVMREALTLAQQALNAAPRFRVGDTDSYTIASIVDKALAASDPPRSPSAMPDSSQRADFQPPSPKKGVTP